MMKVHDAVLQMLEARNLGYAGSVFCFHKHFIYEWIEQNKTEFCDASDVDKLDTLLTITAKYLNARKINETEKLSYNIVTPKPKKHLTTEIQPRVKKHLEAVLKDLDSLNIHGGQTKQAIENIREWLDNINTIIPPSPEHRVSNVEDIRMFLTKNGFTKENIDNYIKQFQKTEQETIQERLSQINSQ
jgi:hypothetical protein